MPRRKVARPGLSVAEANRGVLVKEGPDVGFYRERILGEWPELDVLYDLEQREWIVYQPDRRGVETFVLADEDLARAYTRLQAARNDAPGTPDAYQLNEHLEKEQEDARERDMEDFRSIARDAGERLIHAFKKDGLLDHEDIYGPAPRKHLAKRDVRIREPR
jgi:hypothetical protein